MPQSLRQSKKEKARADMLEAARHLIASTGYQNTTTRQIAQQANISYQTLYNYFPSKAHIMQAILEGDVQLGVDAVNGIINQYQSGLNQSLVEINQIRLSITAEDKDLWREVLSGLFSQRNQGSELIAFLDTATREVYEHLFLHAQKVGDLSADVATATLANITFALSSQAFMQYVLDPTADSAAIIDNLSAQLDLVTSPYLVT